MADLAECHRVWPFSQSGWDPYEKDGIFAELTPNHFDLINAAGAGDWSALREI